METDNIPEISGGPLTGPYKFAQLHYHWGSNDTVGSEGKANVNAIYHRQHCNCFNVSGALDGVRYPMELHVVFFKKEYRNMTNAQTKYDGLAVMSFFLEIADYPNPAYAEISQILPNIRAMNSSARFTQPLPLQSFMVSNIHQYYVYNGSLTTPPCLEVVTWLDFYDPIKITRDQVSIEFL